MTDLDRLARNSMRLKTCNPGFALRAQRLIILLEQHGFRPRIDQSFRTPAEHEQQLAAGTSQSSWSFHMATTPDGRPDALAVDLLDDDYPMPANDQRQWPATFRAYLLTLASLAAGLGLETGLSWGLSAQERQQLAAALATDPLRYEGPCGWDPTHCEPRDLTLAAAKAGRRPW